MLEELERRTPGRLKFSHINIEFEYIIFLVFEDCMRLGV